MVLCASFLVLNNLPTNINTYTYIYSCGQKFQFSHDGDECCIYFGLLMIIIVILLNQSFSRAEYTPYNFSVLLKQELGAQDLIYVGFFSNQHRVKI